MRIKINAIAAEKAIIAAPKGWPEKTSLKNPPNIAKAAPSLSDRKLPDGSFKFFKKNNVNTAKKIKLGTAPKMPNFDAKVV